MGEKEYLNYGYNGKRKALSRKNVSALSKEELAKQVSKSRHCQLAELAGIIELSGRINEKTKGLELDTETCCF